MRRVITLVRYYLTCVASHSLIITLAFSMMFIPTTGHSAELSIEADLEQSLIQSMSLVNAIRSKLHQGLSAVSEITRLKANTDNIKVANLLLDERFKLREEKVKALGFKAVERHNNMVEAYRKALTEYLSLVDSLPSGNLPSDVSTQLKIIDKLGKVLGIIIHQKKRPIIGSLPYKHLNYPAQEPGTADAITPAYKGGNKSVSPNDTTTSPEAPISKEIASVAQSLNWQPVAIYEYVKNNIETEWYWGCQKGAEETWRQKSGNDCDQATLLTALLRASGFPTRYVRGTIEFFASDGKPIERVKNLTGIDDPAKIAAFFQKAGIPNKPIIAGGVISNFQIEHIYVESYIPMSNYRGVVLDEHGKTWIGLDTSIKVKDYVYNAPKDLFELPVFSGQLSAVRDDYLTVVLTQTPLEYLQSRINTELVNQNSQLTYADFLRTRVLTPEHMNILPGSMQFTLIKATNEYTRIPDELIHKVKLSAVSDQLSANSDKLLEITLPLYKLSNQQIAITYEPETVQDQEIIDSYGGLDNTPAYLVHLRPVLKVNGERIVVAQGGVPMGNEFNLTIDLISPNGTQSITNRHIVGNLSVIGITAQKAVLTPSPLAGEGGGEGAKDAARLLYEEVMNYNDRWNKAEDELASLFHVSITRPVPSVVTLGGVVDITYLLDQPHGFTWKGVYVDADLRRIETVTGTKTTDDRQKLFMQLSSLQGSILENRIFEDDFKVESISTAKLMQLYLGSSNQLLTINKTNIDSVLPTLPFDENIKEDIVNTVNQNYIVRIPNFEISYKHWIGTGYIKEKPETGESGWMLTGMIAGGMPVEIPAEWLNQFFANTLSTPFTGPTNPDPKMAAAIFKIAATDMQPGGVVGNILPQPLSVFVSDVKKIPVEGASVTFEIIAGGGDFGKLQCLDANGNPVGQAGPTCVAPTSHTGFARAKLTLGKKTNDNPFYLKLKEADTYYTQVGLNLVTASVTGYSGDIPLTQPFEEYGAPDEPKNIVKIMGDGASSFANAPAGTIKASVVDQYENPISNVKLKFTVKPAESGADPPAPLPAAVQYPPVLHPGDLLPSGLRNIRFYTHEECMVSAPLIEDCTTYDPLERTTQYFGTQAETILGNTVGTKYTVEVTALLGLATNPTATFTLYSAGYRNQVDTYIPDFLEIIALRTVNDSGQSIDAAKVRTALKAPLASTLLLNEDDAILGASFPCVLGGQQTQCRHISSTGTIKTRKISDGVVVYTTKAGNGAVGPVKSVGNGRYQAAFTTGPTPTVNLIQANGTAIVTVPEVFDSLSGSAGYVRDNQQNTIPTRIVTLQTGQEALFNTNSLELIPPTTTAASMVSYTVYGVDAQLTIEPGVILLSDKGYSTTDITFNYTILPREYNAINADIDLFKADQNKVESWDGWLPGDETQGQGTTALVNGTSFDIANLYTAEVVLNRGTDAEVRSARKELTLAQIKVSKNDNTSVDEIKFSSGSKPDKTYHIELASRSLFKSCLTLTGRISSINNNGQTVTVPGEQNEYYSSTYQLKFTPVGNTCNVAIEDTASSGTKKPNFIVCNQARMSFTSSILEDKAVLYGGIGNTLKIEINGAEVFILIEPEGVIVLGIDGLRQDVLYAKRDDNSTDVKATYTDDKGCVTESCHVEQTDLKGLCSVMGGMYTDKCDTTGWDKKHIKIPNVTAIFPSITLASWASIFTGKMPSEPVYDTDGKITGNKGTGIVGNEFFARDLYAKGMGAPSPKITTTTAIPPLDGYNPIGVVSFDSGAFKGYDKVDVNSPNFFIPSQKNWEPSANAESTPQNDKNILTAEKTLFESIGMMPGVREYAGRTQTDATVVAYSHYARGATNWLTFKYGLASYSWTFRDANTIDKASWNRFEEYLNGKYLTNKSRNTVPFSPLTVWYLAGLDHKAHISGMGAYKSYFTGTTDDYIMNLTKWLKSNDEFDNKIFIVVADHGHTAMPWDYKVDINNPVTGKVTSVTPETSCELKLDKFDAFKVQAPEQANNNLHIWELGEVFKAIGKSGGTQYKVLAPQPISNLFTGTTATGLKYELPYGATATIDKANVIAALNGPMAHIYLKGANDWSDENPDLVNLTKLAEELKKYLKDNGADIEEKDIKRKFKNLLTSVDSILIRVDGKYKLYNGELLDANDNVIGPNAEAIIDTTFGLTTHVNAFDRIKGMNHLKRSGDIVLIMKDVVDIPEGETMQNYRYTTGVACKSWHGSLNRSDSYVPLIIAYPGGNINELKTLIDSTQGCNTNTGCDGNRRVTDIIMTIIHKEFGAQ